MTLTLLQMITEAMREVGAVAASEPLDASEVSVGVTRFNLMLSSWGAQPLMIRANVTESFPLVSGTASYTIGVGATFNTIKPYRIVEAYVRDNNNQDFSLDIIGEDEYSSLQDKIQDLARPEYLYFNPGLSQQAVQRGTIFLNPPPDSSTTYSLFIVSSKMLSDVTAPASAITFEPAYFEPLMYNFALRLWGLYHDSDVPVRQTIVDFARQGRVVLRALNSSNVISRVDIPSTKQGTNYNIYTDDYNY